MPRAREVIKCIVAAVAHSRFWHKADLARRLLACPLLGAKRTWDTGAVLIVSVASDPEQTLGVRCEMSCLAADFSRGRRG